jgi:WD40 repeat protein
MGSVDIIDAATLTRVHWLPHTERLACSVLHSVGVAADDSSIVATCGSDGTLAEWDLRSGELIHAYAARACAPHVLACAVDADSHAVLCGGSQGVVMWFDRRTRAPVRVLADLHSDDVTVLAVAERGVALSGADDALVCELQLDGAASIADEADDADAADADDAFLRGCVNVEDAVQHLLVCGAQRDAIACLTNVAVSVWDRGSLAPRFAHRRSSARHRRRRRAARHRLHGRLPF